MNIPKKMSLILTALFLAALTMGNMANAADSFGNRTVRVGFFAFDGYHMMDDGGKRSGYGYDILQHMVGYTNWKFEYVGYDKSWNDMQDMLEAGEIDLLTSAQKTPERMERFDFSDEPIGTSSAMLTVKAGNTGYAAGDYKNWSGIRVGMIKGNSRNAGLDEFAQEMGFTFEPVYFEDTHEVERALKDGDGIDAILTSNLRRLKGEWIMAQFDPSPFYIIVRKGDAELLKQVNGSLEKLYNDEPGIRTRLMDEYYSPDIGGEIAFTAEEREFIRQSQQKTFKAVICPDRAPYAYFENGESKGIIVDIAKEMIARSGLNIEIIEGLCYEKCLDMIESGTADIWLDAWYSYHEAEEFGYRLTSPYYELPAARLYKKGNRDLSKLALLAGSMPVNAGGFDIGDYQSVEFFESMRDITDAILSGDVDVACVYSGIADLAAYDDVTNRLVSETIHVNFLPLAVGVRDDDDPSLFSVMKRVALSVTESDVARINARHIGFDASPFSLVGFVYDHPFAIVAAMAILLVVFSLLGATVVLLKNRKREHELLEKETKRAMELSDALSLAEHANNAKNQFLSRVSHEMRTPLNAIIGFITLAKDAGFEQMKAYLKNSEIAAKQLLAVINDVLDMSAIESGKIKIASAPFDFKQLIHSISNIYVPQCEQKGIGFELRLLTPMDDWIIGDQLRLNQILINLLGNAVKFTDKGSVSLNIMKTRQDESREFIRFEVTDSGCGMSEDMQSRLFKPFEQENAMTAQKFGGSGLGLSIVKNLVSMMNGAISVKSAPGQGCAFTVDIPFGVCEASAHSCLNKSLDSLRVLVVDDEESQRDYLAAILKRMNVRMELSESAKDALHKIDEAKNANDLFNVCIIDWKMPVVNGVELTRKIREKYGKDVIVIIASAYEHYHADEAAHSAGADIFVTKPLFQSSLFDLFMNITDAKLVKINGVDTRNGIAGHRVMLAEDNRMNRIVAKGILEKFGLEVDEAVNGREAADMFINGEANYYDAILMDIQMPEMDGFEATKTIRESARPDAESVPIIALTANAFNEDIAKALSVGMNGHVAKPIDTDALYDALSEAFSGKKDD